MQIPADPLDAAALEEALQPGQRQDHRHLLEVDWARDGLYAHALSDLSRAVSESAGVRQRWEYTDSAPGAQVVASGASAARLTATLDGHLLLDGTPTLVSEVLAPYNPASPLHGLRLEGTPIRWSVRTLTSRGWITTTQFTGELDQRRVQAVANTVVLTALDGVARLSGPASWPGWAVDGTAAARVGLGNPAPQRGLASSVVDALCNDAGLRTRPRPPWESHTAVLAMLALPLCGSLAPTVGKMRSKYPWGNAQLFPETYTQSPAVAADGTYWVPGPHGLARNAASGWYPGSLHYTGRDTRPLWAGRATSITAWIYCGPTAPGHDPSPAATLRPVIASVYFGYTLTTDNYAHRLGLACDGRTLQIQVEPGTNLIYRVNHTPSTDAWRHVHVALDHSSGPVRAMMIVDGVTIADFAPTGAPNSQTATPINILFPPVVGIRCQPGARVSDVMAWQQLGAPTVVPERSFTIGAIIDASLNEISYLPPATGTRWDVIREITTAEYATVSCAPAGVLRWRNRATARGQGQPVFTITRSTEADVDTVDTSVAVANAAACTATTGEATWQSAWELDTVDQIPAPVGTSTWIFPTSAPVIAIETGTVPRLYQSAASASSVPVWNSSVISGYIFVYDGTEVEELTNQTMINTNDQSGLGDQPMIRIVVTNTAGTAGRFRFRSDATAGTDPRPALRIAGLVLVHQDPQTATETYDAAIAAAGRRITLAVGGGPWHQHLPSVQASARHMLRRATQAIPLLDQITTPGDPRRELADAGILELGAAGPRIRAYLAGITRSLTGSGLIDELHVRATHAPHRWALGDPVLGRLGSTAILG